MPSSLSEDNPFRAGVLPETHVLLAGQDLLTGLSSRAGLEAHFRLAAARARRSGARLAVGMVVVDVDPAAPTDEVFGNDLTMVEAARRLRAVLREVDVVARLGETSFGIVAEEVSAAGVAAIARRIDRSFEARATDASPRLRARVGIAPAESADATLAALLRAAEERLGREPAVPATPAAAANAEAFGAPPAADDDLPATPRWRAIARRAIGWASLAVLIALALAGTPGPWQGRGLALDAATLAHAWSDLRARMGVAADERRP